MKPFLAQLLPKRQLTAWMRWATGLLALSSLGLLIATEFELQRSGQLRRLVDDQRRVHEATSGHGAPAALPAYQRSAMALLVARQGPWPLLTELEAMDCPSVLLASVEYGATAEAATVELDAADMNAAGSCVQTLTAGRALAKGGLEWRLLEARQGADRVAVRLEARIIRSPAMAQDHRDPPWPRESR